MEYCTMPSGLKETMEKARFDPKAAYDAAVMLEESNYGHSIIQQHYLRAAYGGHPRAMLEIAGYYITGRFLLEDDGQADCYLQDTSEGAKWIQRAADTGDLPSKYLLARCYADGIGLPRDTNKAEYYICMLNHTCTACLYTPFEALVFGNVSPTFHECIAHWQNAF